MRGERESERMGGERGKLMEAYEEVKRTDQTEMAAGSRFVQPPGKSVARRCSIHVGIPLAFIMPVTTQSHKTPYSAETWAAAVNCSEIPAVVVWVAADAGE